MPQREILWPNVAPRSLFCADFTHQSFFLGLLSLDFFSLKSLDPSSFGPSYLLAFSGSGVAIKVRRTQPDRLPKPRLSAARRITSVQVFALNLCGLYVPGNRCKSVIVALNRARSPTKCQTQNPAGVLICVSGAGHPGHDLTLLETTS